MVDRGGAYDPASATWGRKRSANVEVLNGMRKIHAAPKAMPPSANTILTAVGYNCRRILA